MYILRVNEGFAGKLLDSFAKFFYNDSEMPYMDL